MNFKDTAWWIWSVTLVCLALGLFADRLWFFFATAVTTMNILYYAYVDRSFTSFSVQVRLVIFLLFLAGLAPDMQWLYWIPFAGITVRNLTGYCLMARLLSLLPWNLKGPLTWQVARRRIFSGPTKGSILAA